jgi:formylmethanofuran dehydrogenase subunit E
MKPIPSFEQTVEFHGHACPGLALGYRVATAAMKRLTSDRAEDEEFVAVVENDACGVDAVQFVCGCTFGKGNLVFRDHGKQAFTFYSRRTGDGLRIYAEPVYMDDPDDDRFVELVRKTERTDVEDAEFDRIMNRRIKRILTMPETDFLTLGPPQETVPERARIFSSVHCDACGERVMETRARKVGSRVLCATCQ